MSVVVDWNGTDFPEALKELPAGRYVVERVDELSDLTAEQDQGLRDAMSAIDRGEGVPAEIARRRLEVRARR